MVTEVRIPGPRRSLLFVPGNRPERFAKACEAGADMVCIDLEDAVGQSEKRYARDAVSEYLQSRLPGSYELVVRINPLSNEYGRDDLQLLSEGMEQLDSIMLPKTESISDIRKLSNLLKNTNTGIIALIETPRGILSLNELLSEPEYFSALMLGGADLAATMRAKMNWTSLLFARSYLLTVAALHQLDTIDVPFINLSDETGLREETQRIRDMGFTTKAAIHPKQVSIINEIFTPTDEELENAKKIIAADTASDGDVVLVDGKMIDAPLVQSAQRTVNIARSIGKISTN